MIPEQTIAEIRERTDVVALIGEYVRLKRSGTSWKGLCPFHAEKTPSFHVHPARRFFHCFGCQASGDAFRFVMQIEGVDFREAARRLADRAGIELPTDDPQADAEHRRERDRLTRLAEITELAATFYVEQLRAHALGKMARDVLVARGVRDETAERFRLGYAPHGWDGLATFLRSKGISPADAESTGLVAPRRSGDGHYDRFRHRLMFPIRDVHGRVVAFSGRLLDPPPGEAPPAEPGAKYINSPEGPLYTKGEILYGLHEGRVAIRRQGEAVLCEGNFDLVQLHQAGFETAVAPMGTALTEAQARLLRRFAERVVLVFDGDRAGEKAVRAAFPMLQKAGLAARVVGLPPGSDPDSFLRDEGGDALRDRFAAAPGIVEQLIDAAAERAGGDPQARAQAIQSLGPILAAVESPVEARLYIERIARRFQVPDPEAIRRELGLGRVAARRGGPSPAPTTKLAEAPVARFWAPARELQLLGALLDHEALFATEDGLSVGDLLTNADLRAIFQAASRMVERDGVVDGAALVAALSESPALSWLQGRLAKTDSNPEDAKELLRIGAPLLAKDNIQRELPRLQREIIEARRLGNEELALRLTSEYTNVQRSASRLTQRPKLRQGDKG